MESLLRSAVEATARRNLFTIVQRDVLLALKGAHKAGLAHLDVRPASIVLHSGNAYLVDWGISAKLDSRTGFRGCEHFASPLMLVLEAKVIIVAEMDYDSLLLTLLAILRGGKMIERRFDDAD